MQMSQYIKNLPTPIIIVGMGKSGQAAFELLRFFGHKDIFYFDDKNESAHFGDPDKLALIKPQTLVVSPGYPLAKPWIQSFKQSGVKITSELSLAASCITDEKFIGITGSVAKSTTVSILEQGAKTIDPHSFTGGNLGTPFCSYALQVETGTRVRAQFIVLELSSYQLENCENLHLTAAGITYLSANHLERYPDLHSYYDTKLHIAKICSGPVFVNSFGGDACAYAQQKQISNVKAVSRNDNEWSDGILKTSNLIGTHNEDNLAMAFSVSRYLKWDQAAEHAMLQFKGLSHRLETVAKIKNVLFINDSKATSMDSVEIAVIAALSQSPRMLFLLLGGKDKNLPWENLHKILCPLIEVVYFGQCGELARDKMKITGVYYPSLKEAVAHAINTAKAGDIVLLSPGGTSLDEFKSFEERGDVFKNIVLNSK